MNAAQRIVVGLVGIGLMACAEADQTNDLVEALGAAAIPPPPRKSSRTEINPRLLRRFAPLREQFESSENPASPAKVELGRKLYFEKRLSKKGNISCNSCHDVARHGVDGEATSPGTDGVRGGRNSPTSFNAAGSFVQFWDGRSPSVEQQALGPILNPVEMAMPSEAAAVAVLKAIPDYVTSFEAAFPNEQNPVTFANVGKAIGAFERKLATPSRWDDYLRGQQDALTDTEVEGLALFTNVGCMVCHTGELLGGSMYQKVGVVEPWPNQKDQGRFEVTKQDGDRMMFKVPTLRNIAETAPYFHDGSAATLEAAVAKMGRHQLGIKLADSEVAAIAAWLKSLTGKAPAELLAPPAPTGAPGSVAPKE